ncbi:Scr1 family TA system antitoxin-like transcriptional regulator [Actinocorallia libanotica]|uniref:Scr1 family TA system antitoxin-like transcriptional regulator n=1 Tax=Actinocorallia libanotica TaxID=46162 RepID=UPI0031E072E1
METAAESLRLYHAQGVTGLLQTAGYARKDIAAGGMLTLTPNLCTSPRPEARARQRGPPRREGRGMVAFLLRDGSGSVLPPLLTADPVQGSPTGLERVEP